MKKILSILLMCFVSWSVYGAITMCAENDAIIMPYGSFGGANSSWPSSSNGGATWKVNGYFGNMMGISACLPKSYSTGSCGVNTTVDAVGGEQAGSYCWCKMLHPVVTYWVYSNDSQFSGSTWYSVSGDCASKCSFLCANNIQKHATCRTNLLNALTQ